MCLTRQPFYISIRVIFTDVLKLSRELSFEMAKIRMREKVQILLMHLCSSIQAMEQ